MLPICRETYNCIQRQIEFPLLLLLLSKFIMEFLNKAGLESIIKSMDRSYNAMLFQWRSTWGNNPQLIETSASSSGSSCLNQLPRLKWHGRNTNKQEEKPMQWILWWPTKYRNKISYKITLACGLILFNHSPLSTIQPRVVWCLSMTACGITLHKQPELLNLWVLIQRTYLAQA